MSRRAVPRGGRIAGLVASLVLLAALAGSCSNGDDDSAPTSTSTSAAGNGATTSTGAGTTTAPGCAGAPPEVSEPANRGEVVDLDGDGRRDTAWLSASRDGRRELGVLLAAGGGDAVQIDSASPSALLLLVADADERPPVELFVSDNRTVQLWSFADCAVQAVTDSRGEPYQFDLGFRGTGTGVGCIDADRDGRRDLVGLNVTASDDTTVSWSRTIIQRDGLRAANGATDTGTFDRATDAAQIDLLHTVTCGDLTIEGDGIRQPEP